MEEAYVSLTSDVARPRSEDDKPLSNGRRGGGRCSRQRRQEVVRMSSATARFAPLPRKNWSNSFVTGGRCGHPCYPAADVPNPVHSLPLASCEPLNDAVAVDVVVQGENIPEELVGLLKTQASQLPTSRCQSSAALNANRGPRTAKSSSVDAILRLRTNGTVLEYAGCLSTSEQALEAGAEHLRPSAPGNRTRRSGALTRRGWTPTKPLIRSDGWRYHTK